LYEEQQGKKIIFTINKSISGHKINQAESRFARTYFIRTFRTRFYRVKSVNLAPFEMIKGKKGLIV